MTSREIYLAIGRLVKQHDKSPVSLEEYLMALRHLVLARGPDPALPAQEFVAMLTAAFEPPPAPLLSSADTGPDDYLACVATMGRQIQDLRDMEVGGQLDDPQRYFGLNAPRGSRWYNFDPVTFIECGAAGSLGGYEEGDDTGRERVDGEVYQIPGEDPDDEPEPVDPVSWLLFRYFLGSGQTYE